MKIGLIVYSQTGNTLLVAQKLQTALTDAGHDVRLERVKTTTADPKAMSDQVLIDAPDPGGYDMLYFAAPVQAFSLCPTMKAYFAQMPAITGKRAACFVTQQFSRPWMGGNNAVRQMCAAITQKGGNVVASGVVNWSGKAREAQIEHVVSELCNAPSVIL